MTITLDRARMDGATPARLYAVADWHMQLKEAEHRYSKPERHDRIARELRAVARALEVAAC